MRALISDFGLSVEVNTREGISDDYSTATECMMGEIWMDEHCKHLHPDLYCAPPKPRIPYQFGTDLYGFGYILTRFVRRLETEKYRTYDDNLRRSLDSLISKCKGAVYDKIGFSAYNLNSRLQNIIDAQSGDGQLKKVEK